MFKRISIINFESNHWQSVVFLLYKSSSRTACLFWQRINQSNNALESLDFGESQPLVRFHVHVQERSGFPFKKYFTCTSMWSLMWIHWLQAVCCYAHVPPFIWNFKNSSTSLGNPRYRLTCSEKGDLSAPFDAKLKSKLPFSCLWVWIYKTHNPTDYYYLTTCLYLLANTFMGRDQQIPSWPWFFQQQLYPCVPLASTAHFDHPIIFS